MSLIRKAFLSVVVMASYLVVVWFAPSFLLLGGGLALLLFVGGPLVLFGIVRLIRDRKSGCHRPGLKVINTVVGFAAFMGLAVPLNMFIHHRAETSALDYPAKIAPLLEAYHNTHGSYPARLDDLPDKPSVPHLLRDPGCYQSNPNGYGFSFCAQGNPMDVRYYNSEFREWSS